MKKLAIFIIALAAVPGIALATTIALGTFSTNNATVRTNLTVGDGIPTIAQDGEDAYIEGTLEIDGAARFDGATTFAGATTLSNNLNLSVGGGTPTVTLDGEDAFVSGTLEVDGAARFDGALTVNGQHTVGGNLLSGSSGTTLDSTGAVGQYGSLALDSSGFPVVSYYDGTNGDLKVIHCNDANCIGGDETITSVDTGGLVGFHTSLTLDASGFPVIAYNDVTNGDLKIMHCNDANCTGANETTTSVDTTGTVGWYTSIALDSSGFPVVAYHDLTNADLKVMHCNDANCTGGDETITSVDTGGSVGQYASLQLDSSGFPVVSYYDTTNGDLKVMHCNDANCAGANETITSVDTGGSVGQHTSLRLDASGFPVVSYYDVTNADLKVLHCNDANCAGGDETATSVDTTGTVGQFTSLRLDSSGFPVIAYYDVTNTNLKITHCNDANCAGGDETTTSVDTLSTVGQYVSLALDSSGFPVVSYQNVGYSDLKLMHCADANCATAVGAAGVSLGSASLFFNSIYGNAFFGKSTTLTGFDLAESYAVRDETIEAGDIVALAEDQNSGDLMGTLFAEKTRQGAAQKDVQRGMAVLGVVSTEPGIVLSEWERREGVAFRNVALIGRVPVKVSGENGSIQTGDYLTISSKRGIAMRADKNSSITIGMALENFDGIDKNDKNEGKILMMVRRRR